MLQTNSSGERYRIVTVAVCWLHGADVERRSLTGELSLSRVRRVTTYVGKPSTVTYSTRPTQPFILSGSIDE